MKLFFTSLLFFLSFHLNGQWFNLPKNYMPVGLNAGGGGNGGVIGGELSFLHFNDEIGYGLFFDAVKNKNGNRIFAGPEFLAVYKSKLIIGLEAGAVRNTGSNKTGFMAGIFIPYYVIPYFRFFHLDRKSFAEAGVLVKIPIPLGG